MAATIGADIGGTSTRVALVRSGGAELAGGHAVAAGETESTRSFPGYSSLLRWIAEVSDALATSAGVPISAIGLAVPGILDAEGARVVRSVNVPMLEGRPIGRHLAALCGRAVRLVTDADAATCGEASVIRPAPRRLAHLRLGTGVACGVIVGGALRVLDREPGRHADVLRVDGGDGALTCACGGRGCLEAYASGASLARALAARGFAPSVSLLRPGADAEPESLRRLRDRMVTAIGTAIQNLRGQYSVESVVLGGGVLEAVPELLDLVVDALPRDADPADPLRTPVRRAVLGDDAGVIGAALLAGAAPSLASGFSATERAGHEHS